MTHTPNSSIQSKAVTCEASLVCRSTLDQILLQGAQQMLATAIEAEVQQYIDKHSALRDRSGRKQVVRNGRLPTRKIQTGAGAIEVSQPRINDRREGKQFTSLILPPYARRSPTMDCLIPLLYLKGVSTSDIPEALEPLLGPGAKGLSPANITKLTEGWHDEYQKWNGRSLEGKEYVYIWADGIYFNVRLSEDRPCLLVLVGSLPDGTKEVVGFLDGERESKLSWKTLLLGLKKRGLAKAPKLAVGDGALGFWSALEEVFPGTRHQRCWVHKTANILDKMPKKQQAQAKALIHEIYLSATRKDAEESFDHFLELYQAKYPGTCQCLSKDREQLMAFYDFPAEHWAHLRTTNPIESTFATVRHRHRQTKGNGSRKATLSMVFKLLMGAEKHWRRLRGYRLLDKVIRGVIFTDGIETEKVAKEQAA